MTNTAPRTYTATTPAGDTVTRTTRSARLFYTHIRVIEARDGGEIVTWHTSEALAANGRSDIDPGHIKAWRTAPVALVGAEVPAATVEAGPVGHAEAAAAGAKLATIGSGKTVHLVAGWDTDRRSTQCPSDTRDRRAYGTVYDRTAVVTCKRCIKAHAAA